MPQVTVRINGYAYQIGCEPGEERHLLDMAQEVSKRVARVRALGFSGEAKILVLASLLMADELSDLTAELISTEASKAIAAGEAAARENARLMDELSLLAERAETIAAALEAD
ncbi:cell division protein ZapA [Acetobacter sicerae]|uniref:Cell division protein ZapA n=1 Tax=Acetobacter sicerae TaxID=85325 RepID=A0ABS8VXX6_9PROT|nr:cell division protein ZapA [Acetobacter sicerae]MCE0745124.1 cell division protein ZapA [Acetobacter sicerae]NHN90676.1 cell division protein ZapA [Acetobacter sicerae]